MEHMPLHYNSSTWLGFYFSFIFLIFFSILWGERPCGTPPAAATGWRLGAGGGLTYFEDLSHMYLLSEEHFYMEMGRFGTGMGTWYDLEQVWVRGMFLR